MLMPEFVQLDVKVFDKFIEKFSERYINQRSETTNVNIDSLDSSQLSDCGLKTKASNKRECSSCRFETRTRVGSYYFE